MNYETGVIELEKEGTKKEPFSAILSALKESSNLTGESIVIKAGGSVLSDQQKIKNLAEDITLLKKLGINVIIVHGGVDIANNFLDSFEVKNRKNQFKGTTIELIEMVMSGYINKHIVNAINLQGGSAIGISGKDASLIEAQKHKRIKSTSKIEHILDLGYLGEISSINPEILYSLEDTGLIPVISPIAFNENGETYHVNSDFVALEVAKAYSANMIIYITDHEVMVGNNRLSRVKISDAYKILEQSDIGRFGNKMFCCIKALEDGIDKAYIITSSQQNSLIKRIFSGEGGGIEIAVR